MWDEGLMARSHAVDRSVILWERNKRLHKHMVFQCVIYVRGLLACGSNMPVRSLACAGDKLTVGGREYMVL